MSDDPILVIAPSSSSMTGTAFAMATHMIPSVNS